MHSDHKGAAMMWVFFFIIIALIIFFYYFLTGIPQDTLYKDSAERLSGEKFKEGETPAEALFKKIGE